MTGLPGPDDVTPQDPGPHGWMRWLVGVLTVIVLVLVAGAGAALQQQVNENSRSIDEHIDRTAHREAGALIDALERATQTNAEAIAELTDVQIEQSKIQAQQAAILQLIQGRTERP